MFAIFGASKKIAVNELEKKLKNVNSSFTKKYKELSQYEKVKVYNKEVERLTGKMKPKILTGELPTPEIAEETLKLAKRQSGISKLSIKAKIPKLSKDGKFIVSMVWVDMIEYQKYKNTYLI